MNSEHLGQFDQRKNKVGLNLSNKTAGIPPPPMFKKARGEKRPSGLLSPFLGLPDSSGQTELCCVRCVCPFRLNSEEKKYHT